MGCGAGRLSHNDMSQTPRELLCASDTSAEKFSENQRTRAGERRCAPKPEGDVLAATDIITTDSDLSPAEEILMALI